MKRTTTTKNCLYGHGHLILLVGQNLSKSNSLSGNNALWRKTPKDQFEKEIHLHVHDLPNLDHLYASSHEGHLNHC